MKNILLILTDQQHFRTLRANGCPEADTPCLDRLASEGINFQQHHVANPVCSPSRGAIWSGRLPSENGLYANGCSLDEDAATLPRIFRDAGFATAHFGKLHLEPVMNQGLKPRAFGFETCEIGEGDQYLTHDAYNLWLRASDPKAFFDHYHRMGEKGHARAYASNLPEHLSHSSWVAERSGEWLSGRRGDERPFFLSLGFFDPHHAWNPCEPYASRWAFRPIAAPITDPEDLARKPAHWAPGHGMDVFDLSSIIRAYHAMISHVDACISRVLNCLADSGRIQDTIVVFSSDHGEFLGNHGRLFKGPFLCDDLLKVPLIVWDGAQRVSGQTCSALTSSLDLHATLPAMAGMDIRTSETAHRFLDRDLKLLPDGRRDFALSEWRCPPFDRATGNILSLRSETERYVLYPHTGEEEYYLHRDDPLELRNLAHSPATAKRRSKLRSIALDSFPPVESLKQVPAAPW